MRFNSNRGRERPGPDPATGTYLITAVALLAGCGPSRPQPSPADRLSPGLAEAVDSIARRYADSAGLPGLSVGLLVGDSVVYRGGFGGTGPTTVFHMASVSKPFVATAVIQLVEEGKVALDSILTSYLPGFRMKDPRASAITVRQVLTHTAGLPDVTDYGWRRPEYDDDALARWVGGLADSALIAAPGERWQYSNIGFEVLAHLVATVAGAPFEEVAARRIFRPLRMSRSTFLMTDIDSSAMAPGHTADSAGRFRPTGVYPYNRRHAGSSTLHSSVDDMLRFAAANLRRGSLDGETLLRPASYQALWRSERELPEFLERARQAGFPVPFESLAMGLGWFLSRRGGHRLVWHSGGDTGFSTNLTLAPDDRIAVVVMSNADGVNLLGLAGRLLERAFAHQ